MTYDYNEFMNQFAGVQEYKCGGKTKIESASCGCKSKKVKKAEAGMKNKKQDPDANDNAAVKPGDKVDPWMLNNQQPKNQQPKKQTSENPNFFDKFKKATTAASGIVNATKKLVKRK